MTRVRAVEIVLSVLCVFTLLLAVVVFVDTEKLSEQQRQHSILAASNHRLALKADRAANATRALLTLDLAGCASFYPHP